MSDYASRIKIGPFVVAAAIRVGDIVWTLPPPARHCHLVNAWAEAHQQRLPKEAEQGFLISRNQFVSRSIAAELAYLAGQVEHRKRALFSEDLW